MLAAHAKPYDEILENLGVDASNGLSLQEAEKRLKEYGPNSFPTEHNLSSLQIFFRQFRNPLIWILIGAGVMGAVFKKWLDAGVIGVVVIFNVILGFVQEKKAQEAIKELESLSKPLAKVLRNGQLQELPASKVVPGDILILTEGDSVPADARLTEADELKVDESVLTGESVRVNKQTEAVKENVVLGDQKSLVFAGTYVVNGNGRAVVVATGLKTKIGKIAAHVTQSEEVQTPLQKDLANFSRWAAVAVVFLALIIFLLGILRGEKLFEMFLFAIALAVSAIPEGLVIGVTMALAIGVVRMSRRKAIIRQMPAVEGLGAVTVIAADKTGTLTQNQLAVQKVFFNDQVFEAKPPFQPHEVEELIKIAVLTNNAESNDDGGVGDPLEVALLNWAQQQEFDPYKLRSEYKRTLEIPFSSETRFMATINRNGKQETGNEVLHVKGAPKVVINACEFTSENERNQVLHEAREMAGEGLKVLAFARKEGTTNKPLRNLNFIGLIGLADPLREEAVQAVADAQLAGIRVLMLTGDHRLTASSIAAQAGIKNPQQALKGVEIDNLPEKELRKEIARTNVFARVTPDHKLKIIQLLQKQGDIVAMTGDGVNDAPALTSADIGVSMGEGGTDVARSASDIIIQDNNFATIVAAVEEGRGIFDNLRKMILYLLSTNVGEVLVTVGALLLQKPLPLFPTQILWLNLVTDGLPDSALIMEPKDKKILKRPPRDPHAFILDKVSFVRMLIIGAVMSLPVLWLFNYYLNVAGVEKARTIAFATMALMQLVNGFNMQDPEESVFKIGLWRNKWLFWSIVVSLFLQLAVMEIDFLQKLFHTLPLMPVDWLVVVGISLIVLLVEEVRKLVFRYFNQY